MFIIRSQSFMKKVVGIVVIIQRPWKLPLQYNDTIANASLRYNTPCKTYRTH